MTSPAGTDRAQLSSEKLTLTATRGRGARTSREKETILTSPPQVLAHGPPTKKSARKAAPRRRRRRQHPDSGRPSSVGLLCCCCRALRGRRLRTDHPGLSDPLRRLFSPVEWWVGRAVGRSVGSNSFFFFWLFFPCFSIQKFILCVSSRNSALSC